MTSSDVMIGIGKIFIRPMRIVVFVNPTLFRVKQCLIFVTPSAKVLRIEFLSHMRYHVAALSLAHNITGGTMLQAEG